MSNRYIKFRFENAKVFPKNKWTKDFVSNLSVDNKGKFYYGRSKRGGDNTTSFKSPITINHVSNMLHTLVGERPVPSFRYVFYGKQENIFNIAKESFIKIDSPKINVLREGVEYDEFIPENICIDKSPFDAWSKPSKLHWFKIKQYMRQDYDDFISILNESLGYNVTKYPFEDLRMGYNKFGYKLDPVIDFLSSKRRTPIINFMTKETFQRSEVTSSVAAGLGETVNNGVDVVNILSGEIIIPYTDEFYNKMITSTTNILDGGYVEMVGIYYGDEISDINEFKHISEFSNETH